MQTSERGHIYIYLREARQTSFGSFSMGVELGKTHLLIKYLFLFIRCFLISVYPNITGQLVSQLVSNESPLFIKYFKTPFMVPNGKNSEAVNINRKVSPLRILAVLRGNYYLAGCGDESLLPLVLRQLSRRTFSTTLGTRSGKIWFFWLWHYKRDIKFKAVQRTTGRKWNLKFIREMKFAHEILINKSIYISQILFL